VVISVHFVGALFGVPIGWLGVKRVAGKVAIVISLLALGLGVAGVATADSWTLLLVSSSLSALDSARWISRSIRCSREPRSSATAPTQSGQRGYAIGAVVGPFLVIILRPTTTKSYLAPWRSSRCYSRSQSRRHRAAVRVEHHEHREVMARAQRRAILLTFIVAYILYVACESSARAGLPRTSIVWVTPRHSAA